MHYLWLDLETTGLDPARDLILEIGARLTGKDVCKPLAEFHRVIGHSPPLLDALMSPLVRDMHTASGLLDEVKTAWKDPDTEIAHCAQAFDQWVYSLTDIITNNFTTGMTKPYLAGSSVHFDARFLYHHIPAVMGRLHHRMLDVTSIRLMVNHLGTEAPGRASTAHRVMADIDGSIDEFSTYLALLGPKGG